MILDSFRLDGRVALVTGGTQGLGQASAIALAEAGADVVILGRSDPNETGNAIAKVGRRWSAINQDLLTASVTDLQETINQVVKDMGRLDILVNNAGIQRRTPAIDFSEADWDDVLQVNLKAVFFLAQAAGDDAAGQWQDYQYRLAVVVSRRHFYPTLYGCQTWGRRYHPITRQ